MAGLHCDASMDIHPVPRHTIRPYSFYVSVVITRIVHNIKERLKRRARRHRLVSGEKACLHDISVGEQALKCSNRALATDPGQAEIFEKRRATRSKRLDFKDVSRSLGLFSGPHFLAKQDHARLWFENHGFLHCGAKSITRTKDMTELSYIFDFANLLLQRLCSLPGRSSTWSTQLGGAYRTHNCLEVEKATARLEHILRYLRQAALEALIYYGLRLFGADALHEQDYWDQQRHLDYGWFSEWPNSRRPLSTTWPWNIIPSLVVLWGVCWMFYDNTTKSLRKLREELESQERGNTWERQEPRPNATSSQLENVGTWIAGNSVAAFHDPTWMHTGLDAGEAPGILDYPTTLPAYQSSVPSSLSPYIAYYPAVSSDPGSDPFSPWPRNQGSNPFPVIVGGSGSTSGPDSHPNHRHSAPSAISTLDSELHLWQRPQPRLGQHSQQIPSTVSASQRVETSNKLHAHDPLPSQENLQKNRRFTRHSTNLRLPMGNDSQNYPSPHSDVSRDETKSSRFSVLPSSDVNPNMMFGPLPKMASQKLHPDSGKKNQEPPRNASGHITCSHPTCANDPPVFSRKSEWTKHMDKHTRPYVCSHPRCEKNRGFTYSGGLHRHQREVHGQHGGPKASCNCPHKDCKRSTGAGFSRKENLYEHLRRVHRQVGDAEADIDIDSEIARQAAGGQKKRRRRADNSDENETSQDLKRRRRDHDEDQSNGTDDDEGQERNLEGQVKRLRQELEEKDERLRKLEQIVEKLTKGELH
ncbi:MAG: hypothetical protein Q9214_001150 [Letrouitia sp. 1 TL-2023]